MKMKPAEFIVLSAATMMLTALGIDIMLPAFAELRIHYGLSAASTEPAQIIVYFFMGQIAQLIFGILSDRFGRLPILRFGFPLYIISGLIATFAPSLAVMFIARFFAGMGASAVFMTTIAGVRDRFVGDQMARTMSLILTIFLFTPVIAPFLGLAILSVSSWQYVFITPPLFAVVIFIWSSRLEESLPLNQRSTLQWSAIYRSVKLVVTNRIFIRYTLVTTTLFAALSCYVSSSEHIIGDIYGRPELFAWIFAGIGLLMSLCSFLNSYLATKLGAKATMRWLLVLYSFVAAILLGFTLITKDPPDITIFFLAVAILMAINISIEPNSSSLALEPMGEMAGIASAVYGTCFFFFGSALGSVISHLMRHGVLPLVISFALIGITTLTLVFSEKKPSASNLK